MNGSGLAKTQERPTGIGPAYRYYVLILLLIGAIFNSGVRYVIQVLVEPIKKDLALSDASMAFLHGSAMVAFYTVMALPVARLADRARRTTVLAVGMAFWSLFDALGALANGFAFLALTRFGVGMGESAGNTCSQSLLMDYFPSRQRARALGLYLCGLFAGGGIAATIGGYVLNDWGNSCQAFGLCGLRSWQAVFLVVGVPGFLVAFLVSRLHEPVRGAIDGEAMVPPPGRHWRQFGIEVAMVLPIVAAVLLWRERGQRAALRNLGWSAVVAVIAIALGYLTGDWPQWLSLFFSINAILSWVQHTIVTDPAQVRLTIGTPAFSLSLAGLALMSAISGAGQFWTIPMAIRTFGIPSGQAGLIFGPVLAVSSVVGVVGGSLCSDLCRARSAAGHLNWAFMMLFVMPAALAGMLLAPNITIYTVAAALFTTSALAWISSASAFPQDLVLPRMRATTSAIYALVMTVAMLAIGPYTVGKIVAATGSLHTALGASIALAPIAAIFFLFSRRLVGPAIDTRFERAGVTP